MSLGSNVRSSNLSQNTKEIITGALSELPYNVLWKWETDHFPNKPTNIFISKWFSTTKCFGTQTY